MSTPWDFLKYESSELVFSGVKLSEIARRHGTPLYVYSAEAFLAPLRELQAGLKPVNHLICFAVKSNSNLAVLKLLGDAGAGMDLVSGGEMFRALRAGVPAQRIVFSGVGKTASEMGEALKQGIFSFNVESEPELKRLSEVASKLGKRARVLLRFNPDVDAKTHPYISTGLKRDKFGLEKREILAIAKNLLQYPGIDWRGLSIHIGSQILTLSPLGDAFSRVRDLLEKLNKMLPTPLDVVDLGGGLGITYKNEKRPSIAKYCELILKHFGPRSKISHPVKILIEPGRSISGNAGLLLSEILYRKERGTKDFLIIDAAMNDLIRPALYESYHEIVPVRGPASKKKLKKSNIVGPVCESSDCFASDRPFPVDAQPGELVALLSSGAYGFTMASSYNTRPRPAEVLIENGSVRVIRERETLEDLVRGESL